MEAGSDRVFHVVPIALADAQDEARELRKIVEDLGDERYVVSLQPGRVVSELFIDGRSEWNDIAGEKNPQPEFLAENVEQDCEAFPEKCDSPLRFRLVQWMGGEMGEIVQSDGIVTQG